MEVIWRFIISLGLKGDCPVGLLDSSHVLLHPVLEEDYTRFFVCRTWFIQGSHMIVSKWTLAFKASQEVSIVLVWTIFPELPLPFFGKQQVSKLASTLGRLLKINAVTGALSRPSVARVFVEVDVSLQTVERVWIGDEDYGFWQKVEFESWPLYCSYCEKIGHEELKCYKKNPL